MTETWSYYSAGVIKIADQDLRTKYWERQFIKITQTTNKYFLITDVTYTNPHTYLTIDGGGLYTLEDAEITAHNVSINFAPKGIPYEFSAGGGGGGTASFWMVIPGTPTRVSDTQFTITDTGNANKYDLIFKKGVLIRWDESGSFQVGMIVSSSYGSDTVTVNLVGCSLTAGFTSLKYCILMAPFVEFYLPGNAPVASVPSFGVYIPPYDIYPISADLILELAGSGTGTTQVDLNDDGSSLFATNPQITGTGLSDIDNVVTNPVSSVSALSYVTADWDSSTSAPPSEGHIYLWYMPVSWRYRA